MDPYIEAERWEGFHTHFIVEISRVLVPRVRPQYIVETEERIYVERQGEPTQVIRADAAVEQSEAWRTTDQAGTTAQGAIATVTPVVCVLPMDEEVREVFLTVRHHQTRDIVTVIEMLSPGNKRPGSDGRDQYLRKRRSVLQSGSHLVEVDLLRGGERMPTVSPLPAGDFFVFACRSQRRPEADVYFWTLRQPLPVIPIPLADDDPDVMIDLQALFSATYDGLGYDYALSYATQPVPLLNKTDAGWAHELLSAAGKGRAPQDD